MPLRDERRSSTSPSNGKPSFPYPAFSKAHSKEAVGSREDLQQTRASYHTPDPTDLVDADEATEKGVDVGQRVTPPSPPATTVDQKMKLDAAQGDTIKVTRRRTDLQKAADDLKKRLGRESAEPSEASRRKHSHSSKSRKLAKEKSSGPVASKASTPSNVRPRTVTVEDAESSTSFRKTSSSVQSAKSESTTDSDATSIAPNQQSAQRPFTPQEKRDSSPATEPDSPEPRTPTLSEAHVPPDASKTPAYSLAGSRAPSAMPEESPMPPPPPPAPSEVPIPKVDYLLQYGGLQQPLRRSLLDSTPSAQVSATRGQTDSFFTPLHKVLDDYSKVISKKGSLAVATGYRSVARRLLDRLEAVFARDISSESCICDLCRRSDQENHEVDDKRSVSWGEILEYVCGRQELPQWPTFVFDNAGLGISASENVQPMQKLDIDVPDEFREHYVRQSKRTKQAVDRWLENQPASQVNLPSEVDDETLTFAMLTRLDADQRPLFSSMLGVASSRPASTCSNNSTSTIMSPPGEVLQKTGLAIQRLYRLPTAPRDPESALYLLNNPNIHNVLATLAAISDGEWDILISGRFDGFLRSGAEDELPTPTVNNPLPFARSASRSNNNGSATFGISSSTTLIPSAPHQPILANTMYPPSRGPTPFSNHNASTGGPVALDEETEIAALAEIEREIYLGMETLEDAFEALHVKAETVRHALRERGAGLAQASQNRKNGGPLHGASGWDSRLGTPASIQGNWESETDDGLDDTVSELAPDDSASNVSRSRVRRPRRRNERRTPAPVEEEDEEAAGD